MFVLHYVCVIPVLMGLQPFQDEIESLQKEMEELRGKYLSLESQLKTVLDPEASGLCNKNEESSQTTEEASGAVPETLEELTKKLKAANDLYEKMKDEAEKLKEVTYLLLNCVPVKRLMLDK